MPEAAQKSETQLRKTPWICAQDPGVAWRPGSQGCKDPGRSWCPCGQPLLSEGWERCILSDGSNGWTVMKGPPRGMREGTGMLRYPGTGESRKLDRPGEGAGGRQKA